MGTYRPLFSVSVTHLFFSGGDCSGLDFIPIPRSSQLLHKTGLLTRKSANGIRVFYDSAQSETLGLYLSDPEAPFRLQYLVFSKDLFFKNFTAGPAYKEAAVLYFDNRKATPDQAEQFRLHNAVFVSENDFISIDSPLLKDILGKKERLIKPLFVLDLHIKALTDHTKALTDHTQNYCLKFQARKTFWKYYLLGNMARENAYISDLNNTTTFEFSGSESISNHKTALTFTSKTPIPLRETPNTRFQLRERREGNGKVLIKRLPVASVRQINKEIINGKESIVSEIYVNC